MQYHTQLGFGRDPFALTPEPAFFHPSDQHGRCLRALEAAVRRRRGLTAVVGSAGSGKTILLRRFASRLGAVVKIDVHTLHVPEFPSARAFLDWLCLRFTGLAPEPYLADGEVVEDIHKALRRRGAGQYRVVLIIDEAQRISPECLEVLRGLLEDGPGRSGSLQVALFGRPQLETVLEDMGANLLRLEPLSRRQVQALIRYRLDRAMIPGKPRPNPFTTCAVWTIHKAANGNPAKVVRLCRMALSALADKGGERVTAGLVRRCLRQDGERVPRWGLPCPVPASILAVAAMLVLAAGAGFLVRYVPAVSSVLTGLDRATAAVEDTGQSLDVPVLEPAVRGDPPGSTPPTNIKGGERTAISKAEGSVVASAASGRVPSLEELPGSLGVIRLMPGETVSELIGKVYGADDLALERLVAEANPGLGDLARVKAGTPVNFPAPKGLVTIPPAGAYWVGLSVSDRLEKAYALLRQLRYFDLECRILPSWSETDGLVFLVALPTPYEDRTEALAAAAGLPLSLQSVAQPWNAALMGYAVVGALYPD